MSGSEEKIIHVKITFQVKDLIQDMMAQNNANDGNSSFASADTSCDIPRYLDTSEISYSAGASENPLAFLQTHFNPTSDGNIHLALKNLLSQKGFPRMAGALNIAVTALSNQGGAMMYSLRDDPDALEKWQISHDKLTYSFDKKQLLHKVQGRSFQAFVVEVSAVLDVESNGKGSCDIKISCPPTLTQELLRGLTLLDPHQIRTSLDSEIEGTRLGSYKHELQVFTSDPISFQQQATPTISDPLSFQQQATPTISDPLSFRQQALLSSFGENAPSKPWTYGIFTSLFNPIAGISFFVNWADNFLQQKQKDTKTTLGEFLYYLPRFPLFFWKVLFEPLGQITLKIGMIDSFLKGKIGIGALKLLPTLFVSALIYGSALLALGFAPAAALAIKAAQIMKISGKIASLGKIFTLLWERGLGLILPGFSALFSLGKGISQIFQKKSSPESSPESPPPTAPDTLNRTPAVSRQASQIQSPQASPIHQTSSNRTLDIATPSPTPTTQEGTFVIFTPGSKPTENSAENTRTPDNPSLSSGPS